MTELRAWHHFSFLVERIFLQFEENDYLNCIWALSFFNHKFSWFLKSNWRSDLVTSKREVERKSEWICCTNCFRSNVKVERENGFGTKIRFLDCDFLSTSVIFTSLFNCSQTKFVAIILVLSVFFYAIFRLTYFSSDAFDFSSSKKG